MGVDCAIDLSPPSRAGATVKSTCTKSLMASCTSYVPAAAGACCPTTYPRGAPCTITIAASGATAPGAKVHDLLRTKVRRGVGRHQEPRAAILDSQSVKTTKKGGPNAAMMPSRKSTAASATYWSTPSG